jgi:hypothetical protein
MRGMRRRLADGRCDGPSPGEGLVRVVRLMLAHGRVVVMMRQGDKKRRSVPSERDRWCADPANGKLTEQVNLAVVVIVTTCGA